MPASCGAETGWGAELVLTMAIPKASTGRNRSVWRETLAEARALNSVARRPLFTVSVNDEGVVPERILPLLCRKNIKFHSGWDRAIAI